MKIVATNKRARHDYEILDKWEAGLVLTGAEVKSAKLGQVNLKGSYVSPRSQGLFLVNAHISPYSKAGHAQKDYNPLRDRKLLIKKSEYNKIIGRQGGKNSGLTLVPISLYNKRGFLKIDFALGKGKKKYDKRQDLKKKEINRKIRKVIKNQ